MSTAPPLETYRKAYVPTKMEVRRRQLRIPQGELANLIGKTQTQISHYENGFTVPNLETLQKIGGILRLPPEALMQPYEVGTDDVAPIPVGG